MLANYPRQTHRSLTDLHYLLMNQRNDVRWTQVFPLCSSAQAQRLCVLPSSFSTRVAWIDVWIGCTCQPKKLVCVPNVVYIYRISFCSVVLTGCVSGMGVVSE